METNNKVEQNNNTQQKDSNMNIYPNKLPTNIEDNMRKLKEQLSTDQNAQISSQVQSDVKYPIDPENPNVNNPSNIPQNNINSEIQENHQITNGQLNNMTELNNMNGM